MSVIGLLAGGAAAQDPAPASQPASATAPSTWAAWKHRLVERRLHDIPQLRRQIEQRQEALRDRFSDAIEDAAAHGALLLALLPLALVWAYPRRILGLIRYCLLSAVLFLVTVLLFEIPLQILQVLSGYLVEQVNPRVLLAENLYLAVTRMVDARIAGHSDPLLAPLEHLLASPWDPATRTLFSALAYLHRDLWVLEWIGRAYDRINWLLAEMPTLLIGAGTLLFAVGVSGTFARIAVLPLRAVQGEEKPGRQAFKAALSRWWREVAAIAVVAALFLPIMYFSVWSVQQSTDECAELMLRFALATLGYLTQQPQPSDVALAASLLSVAIVTLLNIAVVVLADVLFLRALLTAARRRFHDGVPLRTSAGPGWRAAVALAWVHLLPMGFMFVAARASAAAFSALAARQPPAFLAALVGCAALLVGGLALVFWLGRGLRALAYLVRVPVAPRPAA